MTRTEFERQTRAINARVYRLYVIATTVALAVSATLSLVLDTQVDSLSDAAVFAISLTAACLITGVPTFWALLMANEKYAILSKEYEEDLRALNWQKYQAAINDYKKGRNDQDEV